MNVLRHHNHGAMHMENGVDTDATSIITAFNDRANINSEEEVAAFLEILKAHLVEDACMLHTSKQSTVLFILVIHCPLTAAGTTTLSNTAPYLYARFGEDRVKIGQNGVVSLPVGAARVTPKERRDVQMRGTDDDEDMFVVSPMNRSKHSYRETAIQEGVAWHLDRIDKQRGEKLDGIYVYTNDGSDVDVYVLDTGIRVSHGEFQGRAHFLYNAVGDNIDTDCNGHGTHVAGIIGSATYGVAKGVRLFGVKGLDCAGDGTRDNILEAGYHIMAVAAKTGRRSVINLSLGGDKNEFIDEMVAMLKANGIIVVVAAGNSGIDACLSSPSSSGLNNAILSVGASDIRDTRPSWSNYGACVSITAPGVTITSTWFTSDSATKTISGTSMAAPAVAGVAALVLQQNRGLGVNDVNRLVVSRATTNIISGATDVGGGQSLLYSLIDVNPQTKTQSPPPPRTPPPSSPRTDLTSDGSARITPGAILCVSFTLLWLLCML